MSRYVVADAVVLRGGAALRGRWLSVLRLLDGVAKTPAATADSVRSKQVGSEHLYVPMTARLRERLSQEAGQRGMGLADWARLKLAFDADQAGALASPVVFATVPRGVRAADSLRCGAAVRA